MVADRMVQLGYQTRGRAMFGFGPGLLTSDAMMLGINPDQQRDRLAEGARHHHAAHQRRGRHRQERLVRAARGEAPAQALYPPAATHGGGERDHAVGRQARRQIRPRHAVRRRSSPAGYDVLDTNWRIANEIAGQRGARMDPHGPAADGPIHVAETREQAVANVNWGFEKFLHYSYSLRAEGPVAIGLPTRSAWTTSRSSTAPAKPRSAPRRRGRMLERFWQKTGGSAAC
jgi:hypothetical protein